MDHGRHSLGLDDVYSLAVDILLVLLVSSEVHLKLGLAKYLPFKVHGAVFKDVSEGVIEVLENYVADVVLEPGFELPENF
jgi:hypothetical protein